MAVSRVVMGNTLFKQSARWCLFWALAFVGSLCCAAQQPSRRDHTTAIPFDDARVTSADGRIFTISWHADRVSHVRIYAGVNFTAVGRNREVGDGRGSGRITVSDLPAEPRWYFELVPDRGQSLIIADRSLHLSTAANFRDAGGYRNAGGQWVRMGLAYRSNGIEHLAPDELDRLQALDLKLVCDLRTREEAQRGPDRIPQGLADISADVLADDADLIHAMIAGEHTQRDLERRVYRDFVRLKSARTAYHLLFERLSDPKSLPTVFHCTAGKDRTGWAEAVLLTILGVPRATIRRDYELTNGYLSGAGLKSVRQAFSGAARGKVTADPAALEAAFDEVTRDYGSFDNYLHSGLELTEDTLESIRANFLAG